MSPVDLTAARARAAAEMADTCRITRNPQGRRNATVDPATLALVDDVPVLVYEGVCSLNTDTRQSSRTADTLSYRAMIPAGSPMPRAGDTFLLVASGDAFLVGKVLTVTDVDARSQVVVRAFSVHLTVASQAVPS